jgi:1-acylglycerone phosphate reductase
LEIEKVNAIFDVNLYGPMRMVKEFAVMLIASGDGRIVQIGSTAAVIPVPFSSVYNASKAALHAYSNTIRVELAPFKYVALDMFLNHSRGIDPPLSASK